MLIIYESGEKMQIKRKFISKVLLFVLMFTYIISAYAQGTEKLLPSGIKYKEIGSRIEEYVKKNKETTAGMSVAILDRDNVIYRNNFGYMDKEKGYAVDDETVFEWGSVSKLLIWTSVMQLWEQGKINLEADIKTYLPDGFLTNLSYDKPITMMNLMNHNAGFQEMLVNLFVKDMKNINSLEEALKTHKPEQVYEPGTVMAYSNWGSALAAYIVERISGKSYSEYVNENIFKPLGMEHTSITVDLTDNSWVKNQRKKLQCYNVDGVLIPECIYYISLYPMGACTGTINDLTIFVKELLSKDGQESLLFKKRSTLDKMLSPTLFYGDTNNPHNCHGYLTQEYGVSVLGHGGNTLGFSANVLFNKELGVATVVMTNQRYENVYNHDMMNLIFGEFKKSKYYNYNKAVTNDFFINARTVVKGPLSILSIIRDTSKNSEEDLKSFFVYSSNNHISKITWAGADWIQVNALKVYFIRAMLCLVILGFIYSLITLIFGGCIFRLIKGRKKEELSKNRIEYSFRKWNYIACILELVFVSNFALLAYKIISFEPLNKYMWQIVLTGILGILMASYIIYLIISWKKLKCKKKEKVKYVITAIFMLVSVVLIVYYEMYKFWTI